MEGERTRVGEVRNSCKFPILFLRVFQVQRVGIPSLGSEHSGCPHPSLLQTLLEASLASPDFPAA